ncbi:MAG: MMPL family transporter, partial [Gammaproteobacteria bacterium]
IGLGADFAIHFCLHYRKSLEQHLDNNRALCDTVIHTGMALIMCTGATAISFYAFMPTDYNGVAELGWISGTGMLISLFITLTLLPALFSRFPLKPGGRPAGKNAGPVITSLRKLPITHAGKIKITTLLLAVMALFTVSTIEFDHNTLNLQSPKNESVQTYFDLLADSDDSPWTSAVLAHNPKEVADITRRLDKLPLVSKVASIRDLIPENQDEKLAIIGEMDLLLGTLSVSTQLPAPQDSEILAAMEKFDAWLLQLASSGFTDANYAKLHETTSHFLDAVRLMNVQDRHNVLQQLQFSLLHTFSGRLDALVQSMQAEPVTLESLPAEIRDRWLHNNLYRIEIYPKENLMDNQALKEFVQQVRVNVPYVSGSPVVAIEGGSAVVKAFRQAFLYAFLATCFLLLLMTGKVIDTLCILTPLLVAALFTGAIAVLMDIKLNFANIIALPLLLGMGIDSAIYILH